MFPVEGEQAMVGDGDAVECSGRDSAAPGRVGRSALCIDDPLFMAPLLLATSRTGRLMGVDAFRDNHSTRSEKPARKRLP